MTVAVVDVETTGLHPVTDRVASLGARVISEPVFWESLPVAGVRA
ncbi:hypothetical protein [Blastococcus sp. SYSU DS0973]